MFDYEKYFNEYRDENKLDLDLSFNMPDYENAFYLFRELRHSSQYLYPKLFGSVIGRSLQYVIMYDGTCYKIINGKYYESVYSLIDDKIQLDD